MTFVIPAAITKFPENWRYLSDFYIQSIRFWISWHLNSTRFLPCGNMFFKIADKSEAVYWLCDEAVDALLSKIWLLSIKYLLPIDLKCRCQKFFFIHEEQWNLLFSKCCSSDEFYSVTSLADDCYKWWIFNLRHCFSDYSHWCSA